MKNLRLNTTQAKNLYFIKLFLGVLIVAFLLKITSKVNFKDLVSKNSIENIENPKTKS